MFLPSMYFRSHCSILKNGWSSAFRPWMKCNFVPSKIAMAYKPCLNWGIVKPETHYLRFCSSNGAEHLTIWIRVQHTLIRAEPIWSRGFLAGLRSLDPTERSVMVPSSKDVQRSKFCSEPIKILSPPECIRSEELWSIELCFCQNSKLINLKILKFVKFYPLFLNTGSHFCFLKHGCSFGLYSAVRLRK